VIADYLLFLVGLFIVAVLARADFFFTILYLFAGAYIIGRLWTDWAFKAVVLTRQMTKRAFWGETVPITLDVHNSGWLPVAWLRLHDGLPVELSPQGIYTAVLSLAPRGRAQLEYHLEARRRGRYQIGPIYASSGDLLGIASDQRSEIAPDFLTVYPRILPLSHVRLPSYSPLGALRHRQPIFEDPARVLGKRGYVVGDSWRRIDWKATAVLGRLQVKLFEPSIALESCIFLNLNATDYEFHARLDATELAIVVAASLANWLVDQKQSVGLVTNGTDPLAEDGCFQALAPRKGRGQLMRLLDMLARVQIADAHPLLGLLQAEAVHLPWGTTLILISGQADDELFDQIFQLQRRGLNIVLILVGPCGNARSLQKKAEYFGLPIYFFQSERDIDVWRG
jgi:uncharacterized protein (DUF58 family)